MSNSMFEFHRLRKEWLTNQLSTLFMDLRYNNIEFTVIYSSSDNSLLLLKKGANRISAEFELPLSDNFKVNLYLDGLYQELVNFLEIQYNPNHKFRPFNFFKSFDANFIPRHHAQVAEIVYINRSRKLEDPNAIYFLRLIPHNGNNNGHVTPANLEKTRWLLPKFYAKHKNDDISVAFTADYHKARPIPEEYR